MVYLAAFLIPSVMYGIMLYATGTYPFGDNALIISDISNQFASFYTYFKHIILSNNDFLYTFSKTLGGDMTGFAGYYLNNPFLFLLLFVKDAYIPAGIVMIIGLQFALMSVTMCIFLKDLAKDRGGTGKSSKTENIVILALGAAYAFSGYNLAYITLPIYFCDLIMLPLVMLGIRKLMTGRKRLYIISLTLSIIFNYYIGYMICIFSLLYFLYNLISEHREKDRQPYMDFVLSSLAAGCLSAFTVIPTVLSLRGQKEAPSLSALEPHMSYRPGTLIRNLLTGTFSGDLSNYSGPYIYVGEVILVFALIFFISGKVKLRKKLAGMLLIGALMLSTAISTVDTIWHGFNAPVGFAHRYAFIICAVIVMLGFEGFSSFCDEESGRTIKGHILRCLAVIEIILLVINASVSVRVHDSRSLTEYASFYEYMDDCISRIKERDDSFYRIEKDFERNLVDSMTFDYNGISHNSSCERDYVKRFAARMGIRYFSPIWTYYNQGSTVFTDCFLGVRFFISRFDSTIKPYEYVFHTEGKNASGDDMTAFVYENPYALPLVFGMKEQELATDMEQPDLFEIQNGMAGMEIYKKATDTISNVTTDDEISVDVVMPQDGNLYFYATAPDYQGAKLFINDWPKDDYFSNTRWNIECIGQYKKGEKVNIRLCATDGPISVDEIYLYVEDMEALARWYEKASKDAGTLEKITSSRLNGRINISDSDRIVFTIPYEQSWKIKVDGVRVEPVEAFDALLSIPASPGEHTIEMVYVPDGMIFGIIISAATLALCLGLTFKRHNIKIKS